MNELSYTATRKNLAKTIESVVRDRTPVIIRKKKESVVMMCLEDYEAWAETVYLLKSPKNAELETAIFRSERKKSGLKHWRY